MLEDGYWKDTSQLWNIEMMKLWKPFRFSKETVSSMVLWGVLIVWYLLVQFSLNFYWGMFFRIVCTFIVLLGLFKAYLLYGLFLKDTFVMDHIDVVASVVLYADMFWFWLETMVLSFGQFFSR